MCRSLIIGQIQIIGRIQGVRASGVSPPLESRRPSSPKTMSLSYVAFSLLMQSYKFPGCHLPKDQHKTSILLFCCYHSHDLVGYVSHDIVTCSHAPVISCLVLLNLITFLSKSLPSKRSACIPLPLLLSFS